MSTNKFPSPIHPGVILREEFLDPLGLSPRAFARRIDVPPEVIYKIVEGKGKVTDELALLFSAALETSPEMWIKLQTSYDLETNHDKIETEHENETEHEEDERESNLKTKQ